MARPRKGATRQESKPPVAARNLRWAAALAGVLVVVAAMVWGAGRLLDPATLPVRIVRIDNPLKHLDREQVRQTVLPHVREGFLRVDVAAIRSELEALPWVDSVSVRRTWPDVLVVNVQEQQAVARWSKGGLLNPRGERFTPHDANKWQHLPLLRGPGGTNEQVMKEYSAMRGMIGSLGLAVSHLTMNERRAWSLHLDNGLQLRLGRSDTHLRLLRFVRVYGRVLQPHLQGIDTVDLRYTNGFAVRWREGYAAAA